jgi:hypothetical protein
MTAHTGPFPAVEVVLTDTLPASVTFVSAVPSQGGPCTQTAGVVTCPLGTLTAGGSATVTIVATPTTPGTITNTASAASVVDDPDPADNTATALTTVVAVASGGGDYTYDDDAGDSGFDFDTPFDEAGGPDAPSSQTGGDLGATNAQAPGDMPGAGPAGGQGNGGLSGDPLAVDNATAGGAPGMATLPRTGSPARGMLLIAGLLLVVGGALTAVRTTRSGKAAA